MKKLLLILLIPMIGFGQKTYVPDDIFEAYLEGNGMGDGIVLNDSVLTSNINTITILNVHNYGISDLTGIEGFTNLTDLICFANQLTVLDVSKNTALTNLRCDNNQLTSLDLSNNIALTRLYCSYNLITILNLSQNTALEEVTANSSPLLSSIDLRNHNLLGLILSTNLNSQLFCIDVDDPQLAQTILSTNIDAWTTFSTNCSNASGILDTEISKNKKYKLIDLLGRETKGFKNEPLLYIYDDGTVEKRIVIE
jgi:hypothetical protein